MPADAAGSCRDPRSTMDLAGDITSSGPRSPHGAAVGWHSGCSVRGMPAPARRRWFVIPLWLLVSLLVLAAGLYLGYRWPALTAAIVLAALCAVWMGAERLTTRWW